MSRSTWYYRHKERARVKEPVPQKERAYRCRISLKQREAITQRILKGWEQGLSVDNSFARAWDEGFMEASRRTWWRIAAGLPDQDQRPVAPTRKHLKKGPVPIPVLVAERPGQIWSWDITDLRTPWRGKGFKAYCVIDIFSRKIVGWRVENREVDALAVDMFATAIDKWGAPKTVHADSGPAMRSSALKDFLTSKDITQTHNRPRVANDNPYSESEFRTMKYRPNYPGTFQTLQEARTFMASYVFWYNQHHKHSALALFTPNNIHHHTWQTLWQKRHHTLQDYYQRHPERYRQPPTTPTPPNTTTINPPQKTPN